MEAKASQVNMDKNASDLEQKADPSFKCRRSLDLASDMDARPC